MTSRSRLRSYWLLVVALAWALGLGGCSDTSGGVEATGQASEALCLSVKLDQSPLGPVSGSVTLTATPPTCAAGETPEYLFRYRRTGTSPVVELQPWSPSASVVWNTAGLPSGQYTAYVSSRAVGSTTAESSASRSMLIGNVCSSVTLAATPASRQAAGGVVALHADATCTGGTAEYRFSVARSGSPYQVVRAWGSNADASWDTAGYGLGPYKLKVETRAIGNLATESTRALSYRVGETCSSLAVSTNPATQAPLGSTVAVNASADCTGSATPEFRYSYRVTGTTAWTLIQNWSAALSATWNTTGLAQNAYDILVEARANDFAGAALTTKRVTITLGGRCAPATLSVTPASPQPVGSLLSLTAGATCVGGSPEFRFDYLAPGSSVYTEVRSWGGPNASLNTSALPAGVYKLRAQARAVGNPQPFQSQRTKAFALTASGVTFADPNLEAAVRAKLGIPSGPISASAADTITELDITSRNITTLAGIENLHNLEDLQAGFNQIASAAPIASLSKLRSLSFIVNQLQGDLTPFAGLTQLTSLVIGGNQLSGTLAPLASLTQLQYLNCFENQLTGDLSALAGMSSLQEFNASNNQLTGSFSVIAGLTSLEDLELQRNQFTSLAGIGGLTSLSILDLSLNPLSGDLTPLSPLTNLTNLQLWAPGSPTALTGNLTPLASLIHLQYLGLSYHQLSGDLTPLAGLSELVSLDLAENQISGTLLPLASLVNLQGLWLYRNQLTGSLSPLASLTNLDGLLLDDNQLSGDLTPLASLTNLSWLRLDYNQLTGNFAPLAGLTNLAILSLNGCSNQLTGDLTPLASLTNLIDLQANCQVLTGTLAPLAGLTHLAQLDLGGAEQLTGTLAPLASMPDLKYMNLVGNQLSGNLVPLGSLTQLDNVYLLGNLLTVDLTPLVANTGVGSGDGVQVQQNGIDCAAQASNIATLLSRGVALVTDCP